MDLKKKLDAVTRALVDSVCWGVVAGEGTGTAMNLHLGEKQPREKLLRNPMLPEDVRRYRGKYGIYVESSWRLEDSCSVLGAWDDEGSGGLRYLFLQELNGKRVLSCGLSPVSLDLCIKFEGGISLCVFCDRTSANANEDNYSVWSDQRTLIVGCKSVLREE